MTNKTSKKQFTIYMITVFVIAYAMQIAASLLVLKGVTAAFSPILAVSMFVPMFAVLISGKGLKGMGWIPKLSGKWKWYIIAWLLPAVLSVLGAVLFFAFFPKSFDLTGKYLAMQMPKEALNQLAAAGMTPMTVSVISIVQALTYAPFINMFFAIGEEAGWRGYMYPVLKEKFGTNKGRIIGGIIWGAWHWPVIILAGYEYGTDYLGAPIAGPIAFLLVATCMGIMLDHFYEKTECIWVPALGHGAINAIAGVGMVFFDPAYAKYSILGPLLVGVISVIPLLLYCVWISIRKPDKA